MDSNIEERVLSLAKPVMSSFPLVKATTSSVFAFQAIKANAPRPAAPLPSQV